MSLQSLLSIARSAIFTHQRAMSVTAHNVANAETPGYSRQRLDIVPGDPMMTPYGLMGSGVTDRGVSRTREAIYDAAYRRDSSLLANSSTLKNTLGQIEAAMGEPSELGVGAALDQLFDAFGDLANDPSSSTVRDLVKSAADRFVHLLHNLDAQIDETQRDTLQNAQSAVDETNTITRRIAELNARVLAAGGSAPDLEDQRDLLVDRLSQIMTVRVTQDDRGSLTIVTGNGVLVDGGRSFDLELRTPPDDVVSIGMVGNGPAIDPGGGSAAGLLKLLNDDIPGVQAKLDGFTGALVFEVNQLHARGYTAFGTTNVDFFNPLGTQAGTIALSGEVAANSGNIVAGATPAIGDGNVALQLAGLASRGLATLGGRTLRDTYVGIASGVGLSVSDSGADEATYSAMVDHDDAQRQSISGVSVEEEMVNLIGQQQAFQAAARLVNVADEMMRAVIGILE